MCIVLILFCLDISWSVPSTQLARCWKLRNVPRPFCCCRPTMTSWLTTCATTMPQSNWMVLMWKPERYVKCFRFSQPTNGKTMSKVVRIRGFSKLRCGGGISTSTWKTCQWDIRAVHTRENKLRIRQSDAYLSRERSHLYEHGLYKKLVRGLRKPRTCFLCRLYEQFAAYISSGSCNPGLIFPRINGPIILFGTPQKYIFEHHFNWSVFITEFDWNCNLPSRRRYLKGAMSKPPELLTGSPYIQPFEYHYDTSSEVGKAYPMLTAFRLRSRKWISIVISTTCRKQLHTTASWMWWASCYIWPKDIWMIWVTPVMGFLMEGQRHLNRMTLMGWLRYVYSVMPALRELGNCVL